MSKTKDKIINDIIAAEGGYVDNPYDSGGPTNFGVTRPVARAAGYMGMMKDMPVELAFRIYSTRYWDSVMGDDLEKVSPAVAKEVVDTGVLCGQGRASSFLQVCLNAFNRREKYYKDIEVDGNIGPATIEALKAYSKVRDDGALVKALNVLQGAFLIDLTLRREKDEEFVYGWLKNRVEV